MNTHQPIEHPACWPTGLKIERCVEILDDAEGPRCERFDPERHDATLRDRSFWTVYGIEQDGCSVALSDHDSMVQAFRAALQYRNRHPLGDALPINGEKLRPSA